MANMELSCNVGYFHNFWWLFVIGSCTFVLIKLIQAIYKFVRYHKYMSSMPGETDFSWMYGNLHKIVGPGSVEMMVYFTEQTVKFPRFMRMWSGPIQPLIVCVHTDTIGKILKSSEPKPRRMPSGYAAAEDWLGEGLLISNGAKWARNRRLLTPAFHFDILQPYIAVYNEAADILLDKIDNCAKQRKSFEAFEYMSLVTLDVLLRCAYSYTDDIQTLGGRHPFIKAINDLTDGMVERSLKPYLYPRFIFYLTPTGRKFAKNCKYVHDFSEGIINKRKQELDTEQSGESGGRKYLDFLDILLKARDENNEGLTLLDIRNEADTFLFEGHDTTTSALGWALYSFAVHPECQRKFQEEIDEILAGKDGDFISMNDIQKMQYGTQCLKESMRVHTPVPFIQREVTQEMDIDGYKIPKGTTIGLGLYNLHHNATVWEDPDEFRPERFSSENAKTRDSFAFVPFSAGSRNCIGQNFAMHEMKVLLARIFHKYTLTVDPSVPVLQRNSVVLRTENGIHLFAKPRQ